MTALERIEKECDEAWYCNAIRGANQMRRVAFAKITGDWKELPCFWCRFLGLGDNQPKAHLNEAVAGKDYHQYYQDWK